MRLTRQSCSIQMGDAAWIGWWLPEREEQGDRYKSRRYPKFPSMSFIKMKFQTQRGSCPCWSASTFSCRWLTGQLWLQNSVFMECMSTITGPLEALPVSSEGRKSVCLLLKKSPSPNYLRSTPVSSSSGFSQKSRTSKRHRLRDLLQGTGIG